MDFSSPYFDVTQAVVTVKSSPAAGVKTVHQLRTLRLGVQVGTTSYTAATSVDGDVPVAVYNTNGDAKMALSNGQIDAVVADLPTAFSVANELRNGLMVGQLPSAAGDVEQLGIVLDKGSALTRCVSWAVDTLRGDGTLDKLKQQWQRRARLHGSVPGVLVDARRRTCGRTRRGRHAVLGQAMRETAVTGRRDRCRRLFGRRRVRRARSKESRRDQSRGQRFRPH